MGKSIGKGRASRTTDKSNKIKFSLPKHFATGIATAAIAGSMVLGTTGKAKAAISFTERTGTDNPLNAVEGYFLAPAFVDIDGDGDLDLFIGTRDMYTDESKILFFENTGSITNPVFVDKTGEDNDPLKNLSTGNAPYPVFVDIDNDGDFDLFVGDKNGSQIRFFLNTTGDTKRAVTPTFVQQTGDDNPFINMLFSGPMPAFFDIDGDGDYDAIIGQKWGDVEFYENVTGPGKRATDIAFEEMVDGDYPISDSDVMDGGAASMVDVDGDGDLDMFIAGDWPTGKKDNESEFGIKFFRNIGTKAAPDWEQDDDANPFANDVFGMWDSGSDIRSHMPFATIADIDGDGDIDIIVGEPGQYYNEYNNTPWKELGFIRFFRNNDVQPDDVTELFNCFISTALDD